MVHDADDAAAIGDRSDLIVVDVAPVRVATAHTGVRHDGRQGWVVCLERGKEPRAIDVREVDEYLATVEVPNELDAEARQWFAAQVRERSAALAERGAIEVQQRDADHAGWQRAQVLCCAAQS